MMAAIAPGDLAQGSPDNWFVHDFWYYGPPWEATLLPLGVGSLLLVGGWQLLRSGRLGASLQPLAVPLAVAISTPFLVQPLAATWEVGAVAIAGLLVPLAMIPLADGLVGADSGRGRTPVDRVRRDLLRGHGDLRDAWRWPSRSRPGRSTSPDGRSSARSRCCPGSRPPARSTSTRCGRRPRRAAGSSSRRSSPSPARRRCSPSARSTTRAT